MLCWQDGLRLGAGRAACLTLHCRPQTCTALPADGPVMLRGCPSQRQSTKGSDRSTDLAMAADIAASEAHANHWAAATSTRAWGDRLLTGARCFLSGSRHSRLFALGLPLHWLAARRYVFVIVSLVARCRGRRRGFCNSHAGFALQLLSRLAFRLADATGLASQFRY